MTKTCATCAFRGVDDLRCHLNPPQAVAWPDSEWSGPKVWEIVYHFPLTENDDWCSHHSAVENETESRITEIEKWVESECESREQY